MKYLYTIAVSFLFCTVALSQKYSTVDGHVQFVSDAPLELIEASSDQLQGILDLKTKRFAFKVMIKTFKGFNNPLQQVHFYENYFEVNTYPIATFSGKIIEKLKNDNHDYRAKGILEMHGVSQEVIIPVTLDINSKEVDFRSTFTVVLKDFNIDIPSIVFQKIAEEVIVYVNGKLRLR